MTQIEALNYAIEVMSCEISLYPNDSEMDEACEILVQMVSRMEEQKRRTKLKRDQKSSEQHKQTFFSDGLPCANRKGT